MKLDWVRSRIRSLSAAEKMEHIPKGYSGDRKYAVTLKGGSKVLLRIAAIGDYERKKSEFQLLSEIMRYPVQTPEPIEIGKLEEMDSRFYVLSYIEGEDAGEVLPQFTEKEQYEIGLRAGKDLWNLHQYPAPEAIEPWYERVTEKFYRYLDAYKTCGVKIKNDEKIMAFIEENKPYLKSRPNQFQHDDFHPSNLIVKNKQYAGAIDFNRFDWGDPYHDFCKVGLFSKEVSVPFSIGQINGYFENKIPEDFWMIYSLYMAMNVMSAIVWTIRVTPDQVDEMADRLHKVLEDHQDFEVLEPKWYTAHSFSVNQL
ncbi:aminoglycoside phosphotransferase family protein [Fictibacillus sp. WQ 8-8]|uniref:aminoglycoside phosphotransferase family protein n=1 Tax=Fictibacillus sp. WQ 8-8 TaxID=2938788 RepID=UPI00210D9C86|nr:aminoglycoside phosphotransferase family protein [Fictibacillus sp. WQ 8-8]MCQ6268651.1 aminoglycoside phosphotransferase family protein [Fictibacillus sp. WQ 8-8]